MADSPQPYASAAPPAAEDVIAYMGLPAQTGTQIALVELALAAALELQAQTCIVDPYTTGLHLAATRRAARSLAARPALLGIANMGDFGPVTLRRWDVEITAYEGPYLRGGFA